MTCVIAEESRSLWSLKKPISYSLILSHFEESSGQRAFSRSKTDDREKRLPCFLPCNVIVWGKWFRIHVFTQVGFRNRPSENTEAFTFSKNQAKHVSSNHQATWLGSVSFNFDLLNSTFFEYLWIIRNSISQHIYLVRSDLFFFLFLVWPRS